MVVRPEAVAELVRARDWYERRPPGLGSDFVAAVEESLEAILTRPRSFARAYGTVRRAILSRFPYAIFYRVEGGEIIVLAVIHGRRGPAAQP